MKNTLFLLALIIFSGVFFVACDDDEPEVEDFSDDIYELAVRQINPGVSISTFENARDEFVDLLVSNEGAYNDREVQPFFDFGAGLPLDSIYIGMTQYEDLETYNDLGQELGTTPEAAALFSAITPLVFEGLQPIEGYGPVDLSEIAPLGSGQVWEIAVRDLSAYSQFDQQDYETKRDAFINVLAEQDGFLREIQWESALNDNIVVGMTIYESQAAMLAINSNPEFLGQAAVTDFISAYPANVFATINNVLK